MIEKGLTALSDDIKRGKISGALSRDLASLAQAVTNENGKEANHVVQEITKKHWEESKDFIKGIKFLTSLIKHK